VPDRAIIAGSGTLPGLLLAAGPARIVRFRGIEIGDIGAAPVIEARIDRLAELFATLRAARVTEVCMAGAMTRAIARTGAQDPLSKDVSTRIARAMRAGDDGLLRTAVAMFEEQGFRVVGAHQIRPDLVARAGALAGVADPDGDAARARAVLATLGALDIGQAAVAAGGQLLGIETLQGTDAMLRFVAETAPGSGGVLVKRAKPGQDLRVDMPAIGPDTVARAAAAGLGGIEIQAGAVLVLDRAAVLAACAAHDIALWAAP